MAKYLNNKEHKLTVDLCKKVEACTSQDFLWKVEDMDEEDIEEAQEEQWVAVYPSIDLEMLFEDVNPLYPDAYCSYAKYVKLYYEYADDDVLKLRPVAKYMTYPAFESSGDENVPNDEFEKEVSLSKNERVYFSELLQKAIGDKHTPEMQEIMTQYHESVDAELKAFVQDVMSDRDVLPLTVGFVNEKMAKEIQTLTGLNTLNNRIIICADDVRHIIKRHGESGKADHSMQDIDDIARLCYVLANYDSVEDGGISKIYKTKDGKKAPQIIIKKKISGADYIIEVANDSKKTRSIVSMTYLKKATD